jgi:hypothetical protein
MARPLCPSPTAGATALRRDHRARVLTSLIDICGQLERLKVSTPARLACREIAGLLETARSRETRGARRGRK